MGPIDLRNTIMIDLKQSQIDTENNIIRRLAIMSDVAHNTAGEVFRRFTDGALSDAVEVFNGAIARIDHNRLITDGGDERGVNSGYGVYNNIRREGNRIFGDLQLWDCSDARKVMSIAQRTPNAVGNSIHTGGIGEEDEDGVEVIQKLLPRTKYGLKASIDLVEDPAATISMYQNKKTSNNNKEKTMEWKDITLETLRTNKPDIYESIKKEGSASRDKEVKTLTQEKKDATKKADDLEVKQSKSNREILVSKALEDSELPDYAKTDILYQQLMDVKGSKNGDKTITVEEGIKNLIQDRMDVIEPRGVEGNGEKSIIQSKRAKSGDGISDDDFIDACGSGDTY